MAAVDDDPEVLERDIERTQDEMGDTVEKIEQKLSPGEIGRTLVGDEGSEWLREAFRLVRDNPIPAAIIVAGTVWLFATSDSPLIRRVSDRVSQRFGVGSVGDRLRSRDEEPAPIGPPPARGAEFDRRDKEG